MGREVERADESGGGWVLHGKKHVVVFGSCNRCARDVLMNLLRGVQIRLRPSPWAGPFEYLLLAQAVILN
jgi:hypothetical protein